MGLCLSKKDVLIQRPQRDQLLGHLNLHRAGILVPDSPSVSVVSTELSSIATTERALLKNSGGGGAMRSSSVSNMAECGSIREWRFARNSSASSARNAGRFAESESEAEDFASSSAAAPRSSNFSYLSSPMIEGLDAVYGLDNIARSYQRARERFELDGTGTLNPLDEDEENDGEEEELEDEEEEDEGIASEYSTSSSSFAIKKKSQARSLHVFGDVFGETSARIGKLAMPAMPTIRIISGDQERASGVSAKREISVFGADHYFGARNSSSQQQPKAQIQPPKFEFGRSSLDFGPEIVGSDQQHNVHVRSARWGFFLDTSGSDEMEGDEELSRVSTSSVQVEPIFKAPPPQPSMASSIAAAAASFMAVPPRSEIWKANFSHMNPASAPPAANPCEKEDDSSIAASSMTTTTTTTTTSSSNESSSDYSSSSISVSSNLHSYGQSHVRVGAHGFANSAKRAPARSSISSSCDDADSGMATTFHRRQQYSLDLDGDDSDSSTDLFEIENLGKDFIYPMSINSAFLKDPDISYSSAKVLGSRSSSSATSQSPFQSFPASRSAGSSAIKVLGPTLRANVPVSSKQRSTSGEFQPPRKSLKARRRSGGGGTGGSFYGSGMATENESMSFYAR